MNKHLSRVLPLHVKEMREDERPIESQYSDVVGKDVAVELVAREVDPPLARFQRPWLVGENVTAVQKGGEIVGKFPK